MAFGTTTQSEVVEMGFFLFFVFFWQTNAQCLEDCIPIYDTNSNSCIVKLVTKTVLVVTEITYIIIFKKKNLKLKLTDMLLITERINAKR